MSRMSRISIPITILKSETSDIISKGAHLIGEIEVRPKEQPHMSLGNYTSTNIPERFIIRVKPELESDVIVAQIIKLEPKQELILHVANYGNEIISAEVWSIK
jgi:hypothetical protein